MIRAMKALLGLAQREDALASEVAPSIPTAEAELAAARKAQADAEAAYRAGLLVADEAALRALDTARRDASVRIDRAEALVAALRERLDEAREREAEADRVAAYQAAHAQADDARRALSEMYPALAGELVQLLELVARAEVEVQAANADLPRGAPPLEPVERTVRDFQGEPDEVVSEVEVERWVEVGRTKPGDFDQDAVFTTGRRRGVIKVDGFPTNEGRQVELRAFTERHVRKGRARISVYPLAERLELPGLRANDASHWSPVANLTRASEVIRRVETLRYASPEPAAVGAIVAELVPVAGDKPVRALAAPPATQPYRGPYGANEAAS